MKNFMIYVLDTNVLIEFSKHYFKEVFPSFWNQLYDLIDDDIVISLKEAQAELKENTPFRREWDNIHYSHGNKFFKELEEGEEEGIQAITNLDIYTQKFKHKGNNTNLKEQWETYSVAVADPLLICHGLHHNSTVVTKENPYDLYKIPHVCRELDVRCIGIKDFLLELNFVF